MRTFPSTLALAAILLTGLSSTALLAQNQQPPAMTSQMGSSTQQSRIPANPQKQARRMARKLGLTADQQSKLEPIFADRQQQVESAQTDTTLAQKDKRAKLRGIRMDADTKIEAILSDTQKQQYEQMKQSRKEKMQQGSGAPTNG